MEGLELICFQLIASVGAAKSMYIEAIQLAKKGQIEEARNMIEEGRKVYAEGHRAHSSLVQKEASGEKTEINLLLVHAEDQMMSAETIKLMAEEFIDLYETMNNATLSRV